jgi:hypothetical protein
MVLLSHIREASKVNVNSSYFHPAHQHYTDETHKAETVPSGADWGPFLRWWMRWCEVVECEVVECEVVEFEVVDVHHLIYN